MTRRGLLKISAGSAAAVTLARRTAGASNAGAALRSRQHNADLQISKVPIALRSPGDGKARRDWILGEIGGLEVPQDHYAADVASRPVFKLRYCRIPARRKAGLPPVFYFFGGPGRGNDFCQVFEYGTTATAAHQFIDLVTETSDLVLIDHRGAAGCYFPTVSMPLGIYPEMSLDRPVSIEERRAYSLRCNRDIIDKWKELDIDLGLLTTPQLARDVEALRVALGYGSIRLMGDSNGTYRCREYLRQFSRHVESALLFISHALEKAPDPRHVRAVLARIDQAVKQDAGVNRYVSSVSELADDVLRRLDRRHPKVGAPSFSDRKDVHVVLGSEDLVPYLWSLCGSNESVRSVPAELWKITRGDYRGLAADAAQNRRYNESADVTAYELAFGGASMPRDYSLMRSLAGERIYLNREMYDGLQSAWPLHHDERTPFKHDVPLTYVQGEWDIKAPIEAVEQLGERRSRICRISCMGHASSIDGGGYFWEADIIRNFLAGNPVAPYEGFSSSFDAQAFNTLL